MSFALLFVSGNIPVSAAVVEEPFFVTNDSYIRRQDIQISIGNIRQLYLNWKRSIGAPDPL